MQLGCTSQPFSRSLLDSAPLGTFDVSDNVHKKFASDDSQPIAQGPVRIIAVNRDPSAGQDPTGIHARRYFNDADARFRDTIKQGGLDGRRPSVHREQRRMDIHHPVPKRADDPIGNLVPETDDDADVDVLRQRIPAVRRARIQTQPIGDGERRCWQPARIGRHDALHATDAHDRAQADACEIVGPEEQHTRVPASDQALRHGCARERTRRRRTIPGRPIARIPRNGHGGVQSAVGRRDEILAEWGKFVGHASRPRV